MKDLLDIEIKESFSKELPVDANENVFPRQVEKAALSFVICKTPSSPKLLHYSRSLLASWDVEINDKNKFTQVFSGSIPYKGFKAYAMCYGGHQFGQWAGQLGDGRAINIAEVDVQGRNLKFQLKGAGPTPYSRSADGLAVLRSSIREYLCSEAMYHLGISTTRALSLIETGDLVPRDILYNGNLREEKGAVVCRVSESFIRFGNFEIFAARQDISNLKKLVDYTILHHFNHLGAPSKETYLKFFDEVSQRTCSMIVDWQRVGFVHGVMNTDNMSILGQTIDYGPYGWLEDYNPGWTPNTTDAQNKRYRFGNQPNIALWNLMMLANALYPLIEDPKPFEQILNDFRANYLKSYHKMMCSKLGLLKADSISDGFIQKLENLMYKSELDMTLFFRELSDDKGFNLKDLEELLNHVTYKVDVEVHLSGWEEWFKEYQELLKMEGLSSTERSNAMKSINPKYVLRNYMAQLAIESAELGNYDLIDELYMMLLNPYTDDDKYDKWYAKRPDWAKNKVGCSMLSCSS